MTNTKRAPGQVSVSLWLPTEEAARIEALAEQHGVLHGGKPNLSAMIKHLIARPLPKRWKP